MLRGLTSTFDTSSYNYWLEVCALLFLITLMVKFFFSRKFNTKMNILFAVALVAAFFDISLDITGSILIDHIDTVPVGLNVAINTIFYFFQISFTVIMASYVLYAADYSFKEKPLTLLVLAPATIFSVMLIINPFFNILFYIGENDAGQLAFLHGPLFVHIYITAGIYLVSTVLFTIIFRKRINKYDRRVIYIFVGVIITAIILQWIFKGVLLTGVAIACSIFLVMDRMANPDDMIDKTSTLYNYDAFEYFITKSSNVNRRKYYVVCKVDSLDSLYSVNGFSVRGSLCESIGNFFRTNLSKDAWMFRIHGTRFVLVFSREKDQKEAVKKINERFLHPWISNDSSYVLDSLIVYFTDTSRESHTQAFIDFITGIDKEVSQYNIQGPVRLDAEAITKAREKAHIIKSLRYVLDHNNGELEMYYQPIFNLKKGKFTKAEALIRFHDPKLGNIRPDFFIPIAESNGLSHKIDQFALESACKVLSETREIKEISINISCSDFSENPANNYLDIIDKYKIDPSRISFEITETATVKYPEKIKEFMKKMTQNGFKFFLDDFGTGYSNITQLLDKPFAAIKIDKGLLKDDTNVRIALTSSINLFHKINLPITMEGVETIEQLDRMKSYNIKYIQGYYFSRPLPKDEFLKFINSHDHEPYLPGLKQNKD